MKIFLFLFFPCITYGQVVYKGNIINKQSKEKIPYASVGLVKENTGINANEDGAFVLVSDLNPNDTLIISCVGFETTQFPVNQLPANHVFEIAEKPLVCKPITLKNHYTKSVILNDYNDCGKNDYASAGAVFQIAQHFKTPETNSLLSEINICKRDENSRFRIRIYNKDTLSGMPSADLVDAIIEIKSAKKYVRLNLEKYNIIIPEKDFFVAIEWLFIPYNEKNIQYKTRGKKQKNTYYKPVIYIHKTEGYQSHLKKEPTTWMMDYRGKWRPINIEFNFLISAKVKI